MTITDHHEHEGLYDECTVCSCATCNHHVRSCSNYGDDTCASCLCADCTCATSKHAA